MSNSATVDLVDEVCEDQSALTSSLLGGEMKSDFDDPCNDYANFNSPKKRSTKNGANLMKMMMSNDKMVEMYAGNNDNDFVQLLKANNNNEIVLKNHDNVCNDDKEKAAMTETKNSNEKGVLKSPQMAGADSLRGIGLIIVILFHMGYKSFMNAWFCISIFFSLSGFLITKVTVEAYERKGTVEIFKFWAKRISRLFPALLLTVNVIVLSQKLPSRHNDGVEFQREGVDLVYATVFATNYNLVYNDVDDYFDDFSAPSITRHLWTLSIEEQYYIIWPLVIWVLTTCFGTNAANREKEGTGGGDIEAKHVVKKTDELSFLLVSNKKCLWAILTMDLFIMAFSYFSSLMTIEKMGMSAAYYSTWCRMGDIAAGGVVYSVTRLNTSIARRWYRDPSLEPMTTTARIFLEIVAALLLLVVIGVPMIQIPVDEMLPLYFRYFRLIISLPIMCIVAATIQASEPLPRWAIATKFLNFQPLMLVGIFSYGVYVFHWPILVLLGDPKGAHRQKVELGLEDPTPADDFLNYDVKNVLLFILAIGIGYISFFFYERIMLKKSQQMKPWKTISTGFLAMAVSLMVIWLTTKDLAPMQTFVNDVDKIFGDDGNPATTIADPRFTPILSVVYGQRELFLDVLDYRTRTDLLYSTYREILKQYDHHNAKSATTTIVMCKNIATGSPCDHPGKWTNKTYWVWLESAGLCNEDLLFKLQKNNHHIQKVNDTVLNKRCDDVISIAELKISPMNQSSPVPDLLQMLLAIEDTFPGVLNQNSVHRFKKQNQTLFGEELSITTESKKKWDPIKMTILGESIAIRIGMFWKDYINVDMPSALTGDASFPGIKIENLGMPARPALAYYICLSDVPEYQNDMCHNFTTNDPTKVLASIEITKPDTIVIHDQMFPGKKGSLDPKEKKDMMILTEEFDKLLAFNLMMKEALDHNVDSIFYFTQSPKFLKTETTEKAYKVEMQSFMKVVDTLACSKDDDDESRIRVTIVDWAQLVCPGIGNNNKRCIQKVHGFETILPDQNHPYGDSGLWLTREILALVIAEIAQYNLPETRGGVSSWAEAIENPISKQLLTLAPPDDDPALPDLVSGYYLCPYTDLKLLNEDFNRATFPNYKSYRDSVNYME